MKPALCGRDEAQARQEEAKTLIRCIGAADDLFEQLIPAFDLERRVEGGDHEQDEQKSHPIALWV